MARVTVNVFMVRHGRTSFTARGLLCGWSDPPLDDEGVAQARILASALGGRMFDGIWSSDLRRAVETARLATGIEPVRDGRIRELDLGDLDGMRFDQCLPDVQAGLIAFDDFAAPGGESVTDLGARVHSFLAELPAGDHLVVTHGGVMRLLLRGADGDRPVAPCELVELQLPQAGGKTRPA